MITVYSPLTWGLYDKPPPDIPACGFLGELCPPSVHGKPSLTNDKNSAVIICSGSKKKIKSFCVLSFFKVYKYGSSYL